MIKINKLGLLTAILFFCSFCTQAQTNTFPSSGNVGIGTTSPSSKLHVVGTQGTSFTKFTQTDVTETNAFLNVGNGTIVSGNFVPALNGRSYSPGRPFGICITGEADDVTPSAGDVSLAAVVLDGRNKTAAALVNNNILAVNNYGQNLMIVKASGNVGIGLTNPAATLHAINTTLLGNTAGNITEIARFAGLSPNNSQLRIQLKRFVDGSDWVSASTRLLCVTDVTSQGYLEFNPSGSLQGVAIGSSNGEIIRFNNNGNVLIGKTSQTNTTYKLDVNGNVRANKVTVNTTGADFVFDSSYKLLSLNEVENFIQQNHHLPEIASAAEMQANGVDIGENQTKLLQKTEELTLYLIEQNKKLKEQSEVIAVQSMQINDLELIVKEQQKNIEKLISLSKNMTSRINQRQED